MHDNMTIIDLKLTIIKLMYKILNKLNIFSATQLLVSLKISSSILVNKFYTYASISNFNLLSAWMSKSYLIIILIYLFYLMIIIF